MSESTQNSPLQDVRVLLVEDEWLIAMHMTELLTEMGCQVVAHASHQRKALDLAAKAEFDIALLDVNLGGADVYAVAKTIAERQIPFAFVTGYGVGHSMGAYRDRPVLQKPITTLGLKDLLNALSAQRGKY